MKERINLITDTFNSKFIKYSPKGEDSLDGIFEGNLGVIHYWIYMYKKHPQEKIKNKIEELLEYIFSRISEGNNLLAVSANFSNGLSGFGYIVQELVDLNFLAKEDVDFMVDINDFIAEEALREINEGNFDYMHGVPGMLYYLNKIGHPACDKVLRKMYSLLNSGEYPYYNKIEELYNKGVNFGIAHGILGILMVCLEIQNRRALDRESLAIADHCLDVIKNSKRESLINGKSVYYPYNLYYDNEKKLVSHPTNRLAWCSGDLAVSYTLAKVSQNFNDKELLQESIFLGNACMSRKNIAETGIHMPIFCHGTSGAYILYKRLNEVTGKNSFKLEADYWLERTLVHLEKEVNNESDFEYSNLLLGLSGAILAINDSEVLTREWSKIFLL